MFLEVVMVTKELRKTKVSFDTYHIPKTVLGVFYSSYTTKENILFQERRKSCKNEILMISLEYPWEDNQKAIDEKTC